MKIVSGRTGSPHVTSQQFRQMLEGIIGQGSYVITSGENLKPELSSNNLLKIRSGMMAHHGCISCVDIGTYDEVTLTNGSQGMKRIDLIVNRYTRNAETEVENCSWKVIQGKPVASNPAVPAYTSGNLQNGDLVDECPAFEVHYDGINVTEVKSLLSVTDGLSGLNSKTQILNSPISIGEFSAANFQCKIIRYGRLRILHAYNGTDLTTENTVMYTLQEQDRPPKKYSFGNWVVKNSSSTYGSAYLEVDTDGTVTIAKGSVYRGMLVGVWITK